MSKLVLYHFPGACSQVPLCALEQMGLPYETRLMNLKLGNQTSPEYAAVNPLKKVPALLIDGVLLTENVAILYFLSESAPAAGLFPVPKSPRDKADHISGLSFCSSTLHPLVRGMANPQRMTDGDVAPVRSKSLLTAETPFSYAEKRIAERGWWLGEESIVDVYLEWACSVAASGGFELSKYPSLAALSNRLAARPAYERMQDINAKARQELGL
jgi:glutathione S-transferase